MHTGRDGFVKSSLVCSFTSICFSRWVPSQLGKDAPLVKAMAKQVKAAGNGGVCSIAADLVDEACQGAPDDRGAATLAPWLNSFSCISAQP
jgi:hypothetical protein